jgi:hypothetical protein
MKRFTGLLIILFLVLASSQMVLAVSYEPIYKSAKSILATQKQKTTKTKAANQASPAKAATAAKVVKPIQTPLATSLSASVPASASASSCGGRYQECCGSLPRYGTCKSGLYCSPLDGGTCMAKVVASAPTAITPRAVESDMQYAFRYAYKHCLPFFQGSPDNPVILGDKTAMRSLLTPYGTVQLAYDDSGEKGCFEVVINNGVTGTVYFVIDSPEGMKVAAVKWQPGL